MDHGVGSLGNLVWAMKTLITSVVIFVGIASSFGISLILALDKPLDPLDEFVRFVEPQVAGGMALGWWQLPGCCGHSDAFGALGENRHLIVIG